MTHSISDSTLALAGIFQAAHLVKQMAYQGHVGESELETCIKSILEIDPDSTEAVFGGRYRLATGLRIVCDQFGVGEKKDYFEITKYVISIMHLEKKLAKRGEMLKSLSEGIEQVRGKLEHFDYVHDNVIAALADLYVNTISTLKPRIIVKGEQGYLSNPGNANKVRTILLAAIRAAVLWRQSGGTRPQLIFQRKKIHQVAKQMLIV